MLNIGQAAQASGVSAKMIRHYEQVGIFAQPQRTDSGYRQYAHSDVHTLRFIRRARDLGFSIAQIGDLVGLWQDRRRPSRTVKALAEAHLKKLDHKVGELLAMKATVEHLVHCCHGDDRPDCPILDSLGDDATQPTTKAVLRRGLAVGSGDAVDGRSATGGRGRRPGPTIADRLDCVADAPCRDRQRR